MIYKITVHYPLHAAYVNHWTGNHTGNSPQGCIQLTYIKSIDMLNKTTPGRGVPTYFREGVLNWKAD